MNVLSLFDGMSCGQIAINRLGIKYNKYYASEVDKHSIIVAKSNYPNTIEIGDIRNVDLSKLEKIDLLIGGSPCQSFSFAGKRNGMTTKENLTILNLKQYLKLKEQNTQFDGQSYLFWEYVRILKEIKEYNPNIKFLLENVVMKKEWEDVITNELGVNPILINSSLVSAQYRQRLYWTNIEFINKIEDKNLFIKDILINNNVSLKSLKCNDIDFLNHTNNDIINLKKGTTGKSWFFEQQIYSLNSKTRTLKAGGGSGNIPKVIISSNKDIIEYRYLTPLECERLQTVPDNYTNFVANVHRYKMLGNGWTINIIVEILRGIINEKYE